MADDGKIPIKIVQTDLVGDCVRLNRRFDLVEGRAATVEGQVAALQTQVDAIPAQPASAAAPAPEDDAQIAYATGSLTLAVSHGDVPGATLKLKRPGRYLIIGVFYMYCSGDAGNNLNGVLSAGGVEQTAVANWYSANSTGAHVMQQWIYKAPEAGKVVKLRAWKTGGAGTSACYYASPYMSSITAVWVGP